MTPLRRIAATLAASSLLVVPLTACTSHVTACNSSGCTVSLSGKNSKTEIGANDTPVVLHEVRNGTARLSIGNASDRTCKQGETIELSEAVVHCNEVGADSVKLRIDFV